MNLSDHESSESDGDTDAMCGNVLPITNCMEYLHSYSTPIINEDQLMKTKSSKLKDNEHCESVMNVTNDENYTDGYTVSLLKICYSSLIDYDLLVSYSCVDIPYNWSLMEHKDEGIHLHT
jgi:hypothetical protein